MGNSTPHETRVSGRFCVLPWNAHFFILMTASDADLPTHAPSPASPTVSTSVTRNIYRSINTAFTDDDHHAYLPACAPTVPMPVPEVCISKSTRAESCSISAVTTLQRRSPLQPTPRKNHCVPPKPPNSEESERRVLIRSTLRPAKRFDSADYELNKWRTQQARAEEARSAIDAKRGILQMDCAMKPSPLTRGPTIRN